MIKNELEKIIKKALADLGIEAESVCLDHPVDLAMGDYSTNVAMVYAKKIGQNPRELAEKIAEKINLETRFPSEMLEKVEPAGAGFINFYLSKDFFENNIAEILKAGEKYGSNESLKGQKILIEHSSPNLFKEFHIGHMVNNSIGEAITRIIKNSGADVKVISYPSDVGLGIAKTIWAIKNYDITGLEKDFLFNNSKILDEKIKILGVAYTLGNLAYKDHGNEKQEIDEINKKIYNKSDGEINKIYNEGKKLTLEHFEIIVKKLGSKFDDYIFESEAGEIGKEIVKEKIGEVFEESEGAVVFKGEKYGLHTRVFLNSQGLPTYETKDLGLLKLKFDKYHPDKSIFITDNEQNEYMKVMLKAGEQINSAWAEKTKHIGHGRLRFLDGRLSSREGNVLTALKLLGDIQMKVWDKMNSSKNITKNEISKASFCVSGGAVKYAILKSSTGKNIIFDKEKALALEGNTGPYLQYTYARAKSVIEKAKKENIATWKPGFQVELRLLNSLSEVEKLLYRFPEVVERAGEEYEPHYIATYLFELAQAFNSYYGNNKIADKEDENAPYKVALTEAVAQTIKNGLWLLGIEAPEKL
ncbi:arginine--tRNA ligase [Patescibacteria group bacterium]|nr:arginine--tRNA ligase [Patescibacteria group bacterium]MCG2695003.1 arginine--tRNA ligase [Candidatus Parcubacteria bacterium]